MHPTALGGAVSIIALGAVLVLQASTLIQYAGSNVFMQTSLVPVTLAALRSYADLPLTRADAGAASGLSDDALLALVGPGGAGAGFVVTLAATGSRCGALRPLGTPGGNVSSLAPPSAPVGGFGAVPTRAPLAAGGALAELAAGSFAYSARFEPSTGAALHVLRARAASWTSCRS